MLDILLLAEFVWVFFWFGRKTPWTTLLYTAGLFTAGTAASNLSSWLVSTFTPPASPAFKWVEAHIHNPSTSVLLQTFISPQTVASTTTTPLQWIAYSIWKTLFLAMMTLAIFLAFVALKSVITVLSKPRRAHNNGNYLTFIAAGINGFYILFLTADTLGNLAWLKALAPFQQSLSGSLGIHAAAYLIQLVHMHV